MLNLYPSGVAYVTSLITRNKYASIRSDTGQVKTTITGVFKEKGLLEENIKMYDDPDSWFTLETWEVVE